MNNPLDDRRIFTYEEAAAMLPEVQRLTADAVAACRALDDGEAAIDTAKRIMSEWAGAIVEMGVEVKGLWLVDFDNGSGYYCWQHPEPSLQYFHGYEEGFGGRVKLQ